MLKKRVAGAPWDFALRVLVFPCPSLSHVLVSSHFVTGSTGYFQRLCRSMLWMNQWPKETWINPETQAKTCGSRLSSTERTCSAFMHSQNWSIHGTKRSSHHRLCSSDTNTFNIQSLTTTWINASSSHLFEDEKCHDLVPLFSHAQDHLLSVCLQPSYSQTQPTRKPVRSPMV